jgi:type VI secretion system secreted protein VgrG
VTKAYKASAKTISLEAADEITLKTGSAKIVMKKNGEITISGKDINVKGSGNVVLKGSKVLAN